MRYDYLIVGAGLYGCTFANIATNWFKKKCLLIEKQNDIGGLCSTEYKKGIQVHKYGPHVFHTNNNQIWEYVKRFAKFNNYRNLAKSLRDGILYSFPINLITMNQLWGVVSPESAKLKLESTRHKIEKPKNFEEACLAKFGSEIYEKFFHDYTVKQWGCSPKALPAFIADRIPIRFNCEDCYHSDRFYGIPIGGYTKLMKKMVEGIDCSLDTDFFEQREHWSNKATKTVFTGKIDEYFNYSLGKLDYRSIRFDETEIKVNYLQGVKTVLHPTSVVPYTRSIEHKYFENPKTDSTIVTYEYPCDCVDNMVPMYPIQTNRNDILYSDYKELADNEKSVIFGGRLAEYRYYDMDDVIYAASVKAIQECAI